MLVEYCILCAICAFGAKYCTVCNIGCFGSKYCTVCGIGAFGADYCTVFLPMMEMCALYVDLHYFTPFSEL